MAEVTGMTPDRISQEITSATDSLKNHVDTNLSKKADTTYVNSETENIWNKVVNSIGDPMASYNSGKGI